MAGDFLGPQDPRVSPNGRWIAAEWLSQIILVDASTGAFSTLLYTHAVPQTPDWSPEGDQLVYCRVFRSFGESQDSAGLHVINLTTGMDIPLRGQNGALGGGYSRWSPDGSRIAYTSGNPTAVRLFHFRDSTDNVAVESSRPNELFLKPSWWRPSRQEDAGLLVTTDTRGIRVTSLLPAETLRPTRFPVPLWTWDEPSPDGMHIAIVRAEPKDSISVLYVRDLFDVTGLSARQLTSYQP